MFALLGCVCHALFSLLLCYPCSVYYRYSFGLIRYSVAKSRLLCYSDFCVAGWICVVIILGPVFFQHGSVLLSVCCLFSLYTYTSHIICADLREKNPFSVLSDMRDDAFQNPRAMPRRGRRRKLSQYDIDFPPLPSRSQGIRLALCWAGFVIVFVCFLLSCCSVFGPCVAPFLVLRGSVFV